MQLEGELKHRLSRAFAKLANGGRQIHENTVPNPGMSSVPNQQPEVSMEAQFFFFFFKWISSVRYLSS